ncbi:Hsp20/alpha crystallin family protein [Patescibacteria group bacterium]|nr:Hsp20/alpha crystallin family protein [Patescibacteria group bacterium]MBU2633063.1 Hsp20/alpha crystallin family protein [Patescibacteria group bacterium]
MSKDKKSFFERLAGNHVFHEEKEENMLKDDGNSEVTQENEWTDEDEGQLAIDMFSSPLSIVIRAMIADVKPDDLDVSISKDMITIKGHRQNVREVNEDSYYYKELYWGSFSRSVLLPQEVDSENAEASVKNGLLEIRLPKVDKDKTQKLKIKIG